MIKFYLLFLMILTNFAMAFELPLPMARNFFMDAQKVWQNNTPILILFSTPNCRYCQLVKEEVLNPMAEMPEYANKVIIRHVNAQSPDRLTNFYNRGTTHNAFAFKKAINFFPTVLLVDNYGAQLDKIIGVSNQDYYWTDLDKSIDKATTQLQKQLHSKL